MREGRPEHLFAWLWRDEHRAFIRIHDQQLEMFGIDKELSGLLNDAYNGCAKLASQTDPPGRDEDIACSMNLHLEARLGYPVFNQCIRWCRLLTVLTELRFIERHEGEGRIDVDTSVAPH